jgi:hypothetical protein
LIAPKDLKSNTIKYISKVGFRLRLPEIDATSADEINEPNQEKRGKSK